MAGCTGTRYLPADGQLAPAVVAPQELRAFDGSVAVDFDLPGGMADPGDRSYPSDLAKAELQGWFGAAGDEVSLDLRYENVDDSGGWTILFPYLLTLGILPTWATTEGESVLEVKAGDEVLYQSRQPVAYKSALSALLPTAYAIGSPGKGQYELMTRDQLNRHKLALGQYIASQKAAYEQAVSAGTVEGYRQYLDNTPDSFFRMETLRRLSTLAPATGALAFHQQNIALDPAYLVYLPDEYDIWFLGPQDMRVHDVLRLSRSENQTLLVSRIKAAAAPYKVFDSAEIELLQAGGLSAALIAAMIDATAAASVPASAPATGSATTAGAVAPQSASTPTAAPASVGDIAAQCAKRYAAMEACDQMPSFGANICRGQVKKKYSHIACELIE